MAGLIGFGGPIIFIVIFLLINRKHLSVGSGILYSILIYILSIATGIGATVLFNGGSVYAGVIAPIFYIILFTLVVHRGK